eukprot:5915450-Alexandrium_andersonii.AAC.1
MSEHIRERHFLTTKDGTVREPMVQGTLLTTAVRVLRAWSRITEVKLLLCVTTFSETNAQSNCFA